MVPRSQTDTSRESLEASITFMNGNSIEQSYSTPTGSSSQLDSSQQPSSDIQDTLHQLSIHNNGKRLMKNYTMLKVVPDSQKCLSKESRSFLAQIGGMMNNSRVEVVVEKLLRENQRLQNELEEARAYVDQVDVEAEQQYSELSSEIVELCDLVEKKDHELIALKEKLSEVNRLVEKNNDVMDHQKQTMARQTGVIESLRLVYFSIYKLRKFLFWLRISILRDELDSERDKSAHLIKEKEALQEELNSIRKAVETEKGDALAKDVLLSIEIEDMQRELEKQKEILASTSIAQIVDRWERRVLSLEDEVRERDILIHTQQGLINVLKRNMRENSGEFSHSHGGSTDSFQTPENNPSPGFSVVDYILSDVNSQLANVYAIARILDLSSQELDYLEKSLESKQSRRYIY
ncbi:hypothetical protein Angca_006941 [Angiostrongylus cantonensis]|nr:hypothetical protein Angca_006941 [Angiostrongylus cantonensis]